MKLLKTLFDNFRNNSDHFIVTSLFAMICFLVYLLPIPPEYQVFSLSNLIQNYNHLWAWGTIPLSWISHASFNHLVGNMLFFLLVAPRVEKKLGSLRFLALIIGTGLGSTLLFSLDGNWGSGIIGASGIVYGVIGAFIVFSKKRLLSLMLIPIVVIDVLNQFIGRSFPTNVALMGHVGGFVTGLIIALWFLAFSSSESIKKIKVK